MASRRPGRVLGAIAGGCWGPSRGSCRWSDRHRCCCNRNRASPHTGHQNQGSADRPWRCSEWPRIHRCEGPMCISLGHQKPCTYSHTSNDSAHDCHRMLLSTGSYHLAHPCHLISPALRTCRIMRNLGTRQISACKCKFQKAGSAGSARARWQSLPTLISCAHFLQQTPTVAGFSSLLIAHPTARACVK